MPTRPAREGPATVERASQYASEAIKTRRLEVVEGGAVRRGRYLYGVIGAEISAATRYYDRVVQIEPLEFDAGLLLDSVDCPQKDAVDSIDALPDLSGERTERTAVLVNGNFNYQFDVQQTLARLHARLTRSSRLVVVAYNPYLQWLYALANWLGLRKAEMPTTFLTRTDVRNLARLAGYEIVRHRPCCHWPFRWLGLGNLINRVVPAIPLLRWLGLVSVVTLRPCKTDGRRPSLSVVIPARDEKGNIEAALQRMPDLGAERLEILFVEGNSSDGTWEEIQRVVAEYGDRFELQAMQQTGKGKGDAVRLAFSRATGELLTILDADLTMPPELLGRFYDAYCEGQADFINGSRLVYPMEGEAMRFLNRLGNGFFAKALSTVLGTRLGDSLCGTKLVAKHDYERMVRWRKDFGDFDPFGDFELLFPAAILALGVIDVPIRYRARTYGSTSISRFRNGWQLLRMTCIGFLRVCTGRVR